jgi:hypothetical protein
VKHPGWAARFIKPVGTICAGTIYKDKSPGNSPENSRELGSYGFADLEYSPYTTRCTARYLLHVLGRSAKTDSFGRSFAVLSTQVSAVGLRLRRNRFAGRSRRRTTRQLYSGSEQILLYLYNNSLPLRRFTFRESGSLVVSSWRR